LDREQADAQRRLAERKAELASLGNESQTYVRLPVTRAGYFLDPYNPMCVRPPSGSRDASHR
jgi:hypothetical protein